MIPTLGHFRSFENLEFSEFFKKISKIKKKNFGLQASSFFSFQFNTKNCFVISHTVRQSNLSHLEKTTLGRLSHKPMTALKMCIIQIINFVRSTNPIFLYSNHFFFEIIHSENKHEPTKNPFY